MIDLTPKLKRILLLRRAVRLVWQSAPGWTSASIVLVVVQGTLPLAQLYLLKLIVDAVTAALQSPNRNLDSAMWFIVALGVVTLLGALAASLSTLVSDVQGQSVTDHVASIIHEKSVGVDLAYYENSQYYDTLHRAQQEASYRPTRIVNGFVQVGQSSLALLALVGLLFSLHWVIAVVLLVAAIPGTLVRLRYSQQLYAWQRQRTTTERQAWYFQWMMVGEPHAKEIRLFNLGKLFIERFRDLRAMLRRERLQLATRRVLIDLLTQVAGTLAIFGALAYIAMQTVAGAITLGDLVMYYQAFQRGQNYLREILSGLANLYEDSLFLTNLYEFLDLKPRVVLPTSPRLMPKPMQRGIAFEHVRFDYAEATHPTLDDISLTIRPGEHIALVGANGAGKTTLVKLLCRLYDPTAGRITIDGIDLRELDLTALRRQISIIFQDYARYHLTARENIWLGNTIIPSMDEQVMRAAREAGADQVIEKLPHGYDTRLGKWFNDGQELSIGEWQKIALARAFVRDAQIVVLDEPTSALDASAEYQVFQKFRALAAGRTTILISHRFSTVRMADCIYVLANGKIAESGSHDELMRRGGEYARMFELQAGNYR
ncbi:MAG: ABC transporter ATP-binding protein [Chloroflexi bacterium]|nr:ABC transporter ATP-binding protein [Chloroflexota bacterium]